MSLVRMGRIVIGLRNFAARDCRQRSPFSPLPSEQARSLSPTDYAAAGQGRRSSISSAAWALMSLSSHRRRAAQASGRARTGALVTTLRSPDYRAVIDQKCRRSSAPASPTISTVLRVRSGDLTKSTAIVGCAPAYFAVRDWSRHRAGTCSTPAMIAARGVWPCWERPWLDLFGESDPIGLRINISREPFEVAGVLRERGQGLDATNEDARVYVRLPLPRAAS